MSHFFDCRAAGSGSQLHHHQHLHDITQHPVFGGLQWRASATIYAWSQGLRNEWTASQLFISSCAFHSQQLNSEHHLFGFRLCIQLERSFRSDRCASSYAARIREAANRRKRWNGKTIPRIIKLTNFLNFNSQSWTLKSNNNGLAQASPLIP